MEEMSCPKCGALTRKGRFCSRCGAQLTSDLKEEQPATSPPGPPLPPISTVPPPPSGDSAPLPPPTQPHPSYSPTATNVTVTSTPKKGGRGKAILAGAMGLLVVAAVVVLLLGFAVGPKWFVGEKGKGASEAETSEGSGKRESKGGGESGGEKKGKGGSVSDIIVPMPPGWEDGFQFMGGQMAEMLSSELGGMASIDAFYIDSDMTKMITAMHMDVTDFSDVPPEDATLSEMKEYIDRNRQEILDEFTGGLLSSDVLNADVGDIKALQTKAGDVGMEITLDAGGIGGSDFGADLLLFFKGKKVFMVMLMTLEESLPPDLVKSLKEDITFK